MRAFEEYCAPPPNKIIKKVKKMYTEQKIQYQYHKKIAILEK